MPDVKWTAKLPTLIAGAILLLAGLVAAVRGRVWIACVLLVLGAGFVAYSTTIKSWCVIDGMAWGSGAWGQGWGGCVKGTLAEYGWRRMTK